jgi:Fe-S-cluster containining protein
MQTCCQTAEVFVTRGDVRRIGRHTGRDDFHELRQPEDPIYVPDGSDLAWQDGAFQPDGSRRVLKRQASGNCTFLGTAGCTLPGDVRPLVCRIYPYDYDADGLLDDLAPGCPLDLVRPGIGLIDELGMNRDDAEQWRRQLYQELACEDEHSCPTDLQSVGHA